LVNCGIVKREEDLDWCEFKRVRLSLLIEAVPLFLYLLRNCRSGRTSKTKKSYLKQRNAEIQRHKSEGETQKISRESGEIHYLNKDKSSLHLSFA